MYDSFIDDYYIIIVKQLTAYSDLFNDAALCTRVLGCWTVV